jgi:carbon monoxide dehydrogenase subunit G
VKLQHAFEVPASPAETLALLLDAERVVPCMPGATLTEVVDDTTWKAKITVKLGPVTLDFLNDIRVVEMDESAGTVKLGVKGRDTRGKGGADATVDALLAPVVGGSGTRVQMDTDLRFSGQAAQLGRPGVVKDVSEKLVNQFASCIRSQLEAPAAAEAAADGAGEGSADGSRAAAAPGRPPPPPAEPASISGLDILATTVTGQVRRHAKALAALGIGVVALVVAKALRRK